MSQGGTQPVPEQSPGDETNWIIKIARAVNLALRGKINAIMLNDVTLTANATTTTITDERIGLSSFLDFMPTTAHAATAKQGLWVSSQLQGTATLTHANSANTDQTLRVLIIG